MENNEIIVVGGREIIVIGDSEINAVEWKGQRVVTLWMIDEVHGRGIKTAAQNFYKNKEHFVEGRDYFQVSHKDLARENFSLAIGRKIGTKGMVLFTESGYLLIVKTLNDPMAWDIQRKLIKYYFNRKEVIKVTKEQHAAVQDSIDDHSTSVKVFVQEAFDDTSAKIGKATDTIIDAIKEEFTVLEKTFGGQTQQPSRKPFSPKDKLSYGLCVVKYYGKICPDCRRCVIVDDKGKPLPNACIDHWKSPTNNLRKNGWLICRDCNIKYESGVSRSERQFLFDAFHEALKETKLPDKIKPTTYKPSGKDRSDPKQVQLIPPEDWK